MLLSLLTFAYFACLIGSTVVTVAKKQKGSVELIWINNVLFIKLLKDIFKLN